MPSLRFLIAYNFYHIKGTNMGKKRSRKKKKSPKTITSIKKGKLVEQITAGLHDWPNVKVQQNIFLPVVGQSSRKSEIDVLLTTSLAGYPIRIAIECKNERMPIGSPKINAFIGKLMDVGIPLQHGIYVSASGYTSGAIERAKEAGIRPLILNGLTKEGLSNSIAEAFQSVVYLLATVDSIHITNNVPNPEPHEIEIFYNDEGKVCGSISDLIWQNWLNGKPPSSIGEHVLEITVSSEWHQIINGKVEPVHSIKAVIRIIGLVLTLTGQVRKYILLNASDMKIERSQVNVLFDMPKLKQPVTIIYAESQLKEFMDRQEAVQVTIGRIRLPRILNGPVYWPPSERAARKVIELMQAFEAGKIPDPRPFNFTEIEGTDIRTIWEPIWQEKPL